MARQVFLYGIGAAKAGTTWLSRCLRAHPECAVPPAKETHYFDSIENGTSLWAVDGHLRHRAIARAALAEATNDGQREKAARRVEAIDRWLALVASGQMDDPRYEVLMRAHLKKKHNVVADITPAYALLQEATFARMAALNGGETRFLMILRDPVDRLCSNIAMTVDKRAAKGVDPRATRAELIRKLSLGENTDEMERSDYAATLSRLEASVPAQKRLVVFFEDLFREDTLAEISAFIGLSEPLQGMSEKFNVGTGFELTDDERAAVVPRLKGQYEDALTRFGRMPERWATNMQEARV